MKQLIDIIINLNLMINETGAIEFLQMILNIFRDCLSALYILTARSTTRTSLKNASSFGVSCQFESVFFSRPLHFVSDGIHFWIYKK